MRSLLPFLLLLASVFSVHAQTRQYAVLSLIGDRLLVAQYFPSEGFRNDASLQRNVGTLKQEAAAGGTKKGGAVFDEGDVLSPKIANVRLMSDASDSSKSLATLARGEELVVIGGEKDGFINVQGANGAGWVKIVLVTKR